MKYLIAIESDAPTAQAVIDEINCHIDAGSRSTWDDGTPFLTLDMSVPQADEVVLKRKDVEALLVHASIALSLMRRYDDVMKGSESQMTRAILPGVIKTVEDAMK